jgi:ribosome-associated heat shock protein Hsp15
MESVRIDKWLWAARFFKTRSSATAAVAGGKVQLNGERPKPGKQVQAGDRLLVRVGPLEYSITVVALAERRGSVKAAAALYDESVESRHARERVLEQRRTAPAPRYEGGGRPTKRDRRILERFAPQETDDESDP